MALQIFETLQGNWTFVRTLTSKLSSSPSGNVTGIASFQPELYEEKTTTPCNNSSTSTRTLYYLYQEKGEFLTNNGLKLETKREYIYKYSEGVGENNISVYFTPETLQETKGVTVGKYFHTINLVDIDSKTANLNDSSIIVRGFGTHPCLDDMYQLDYTFQMAHVPTTKENSNNTIRNLILNCFETNVTVKGPNKDYTGNTIYKRREV